MQVKREILEKVGLSMSPGMYDSAFRWWSLPLCILLIMYSIAFPDYQKRALDCPKVLLPFSQKGACHPMVKVSTQMKPHLSKQWSQVLQLKGSKVAYTEIDNILFLLFRFVALVVPSFVVLYVHFKPMPMACVQRYSDILNLMWACCKCFCFK